MIYNILRLNEEEREFVKERYPQIDIDNLNLPAEGMSSVTNMDMLGSAIRYDSERKAFGNEKDKILSESILKKIGYYKSHDGRTLVEDYNIDIMCERADELATKAIGRKIRGELFRIDQTINFVRNIKSQLQSEEDLHKLAVCLGIYFGETVLKKDLLVKGYDWEKTNGYLLIVSPLKEEVFDPIDFVYTKVKFNDISEDLTGTCSDYYYRFLEEIGNQ